MRTGKKEEGKNKRQVKKTVGREDRRRVREDEINKEKNKWRKE